jgi:hypothetical protein
MFPEEMDIESFLMEETFDNEGLPGISSLSSHDQIVNKAAAVKNK